MASPSRIRPPGGRVNAARRGGGSLAERPQFAWLARGGLAARGVVYIVVGALAIQLALGDSGGQTTDHQGALKEVAQQPFGKVLLAVLAIGLAGYALWRLVRAAIGHGPEASDDTKDRIAGVASGIAYAALCVTAIQILGGSGGGSGGTKSTTSGVLGWPGGPVLVAIAGVILIGAAAEQAYKGIKRTFLEDSKTERMSDKVERGFTILGVVGHLARTVVFGMIGYFLVKAASDYDADKAVGLDGVLARLQNATYGPLLLGIVAAGLVSFGLYSFADARYRRV